MAAPFEVVGTIKVMMDMMSFSSGFYKREFVVTIEDDYPQDIKFVCKKEKCSLLETVAVRDRVKVSFRLRGSLFKEKYYVDLDAFKIEKMDVDGSTIEYDNLEPPGDNPLDAEMPF